MEKKLEIKCENRSALPWTVRRGAMGQMLGEREHARSERADSYKE